MKKNRILILLLILFIGMMPQDTKAISASMSCSSASSVTLGNTISVTIKGNASESGYWEGVMSYDSSKLQLISGSARIFDENAAASKSYTYTFKAIATGSAYVKMDYMKVSDSTGDNETSTSSSPCNINIVQPSSSSSNNNSSSNTVKSSDNNLKSLSIDGASLIPEFNKDTLEYNVELTSDTTKIKVNAEVNNSKASVSGVGEIEVKEGQNKLEIVVTAENGSTKTYIVNAYVKEKDPIKVKVSGEEYTVVRKLDGLTIPQNFEEKDVEVEGEIVKGCYNSNIDYTLVALKNSKGEISFFIYDLKKSTYSKYSMITSSSLSVVITKVENEEKIPHKYYKSKFIYNDEEVDGYALSELSDFRVVYGINVETGEKGFYLYDMKENTIQRFYNDQVNIYVDLIKKCKLAFLTLGLFIILLTIVIIILLSKNVKFKKKYLNARLNPIDNPKYNEVKYQDLEGTRVMDKVEQNKKSKKTFLDE